MNYVHPQSVPYISHLQLLSRNGSGSIDWYSEQILISSLDVEGITLLTKCVIHFTPGCPLHVCICSISAASIFFVVATEIYSVGSVSFFTASHLPCGTLVIFVHFVLAWIRQNSIHCQTLIFDYLW